MYKKNILSQIKNGDKMELKKIMNQKIISINKAATIKEASLVMLKNQIGFLPVFDDDELVGVITDRDIVIKGYTTLKNTDKIESIINTNVKTVNIKDNIDKLFKTMQENKITRILINDNNKIVGVISISDLLPKKELEKDIIKTLKIIKEIKTNFKEPVAKIDDFDL